MLDIHTTLVVMFPLFELNKLLVFEKQSSEMNQNAIFAYTGIQSAVLLRGLLSSSELSGGNIDWT